MDPELKDLLDRCRELRERGTQHLKESEEFEANMKKIEGVILQMQQERQKNAEADWQEISDLSLKEAEAIDQDAEDLNNIIAEGDEVDAKLEDMLAKSGQDSAAQ